MKLAIASIKQKMIRDMEDFSSELVKAKQNINTTQANIMNTIREKLQTSSLLDSVADTPPQTAGADKTTTKTQKGFTSTSWKGGNTNFTDFNLAFSGIVPKRPTTSNHKRPSTSVPAADSPNAVGHNSHEAEILLKETEFTSIEELLQALQQSEETVFTLYNETQSKHEEVEKMELENKYLESRVQEQVRQFYYMISRDEVNEVYSFLIR